jgi:thioredoxin-related protein
MIRQLLTCLVIIIIGTYSVFANMLDTCHLSLYAPSLANKSVKLGYYYGSKTLLKDTLFIIQNGELDYENQIHAGICILVLPDSSIFEFMIDGGNKFFIYVTEKNKSYQCSIKGNNITETYDSYQNELKILIITIDSLRTFEKVAASDNAIEVYKRQISETEEKILALRNKYSGLFPGSLLSNYMKSFIPVDIRELYLKENNSPGDTGQLLSKLKIYQKHYLDNVDLNDERLLYTPMLAEKINFYLDKIISQKPETIVSETERIFNLTNNNEVKKFIVENQLYKFGLQKNKPTQEFVYASLIENFYLKDKTPWASDEQIHYLTKELDRIKPTLMYQSAPDIILPDINNDSISLYSINTNYTLILFWETGCPYCTRIIKDLNKTISKYSYLSIKVFTISLDENIDQWREFAVKNLPDTWDNTFESNKNKITGIFNIMHTPVMYFLDKDKKIINKNFIVPELDAYLLKLATNIQN